MTTGDARRGMGDTGGAEPRPYGVYMGAEEIWRAIRIWLAARNVGATLAVAWKTWDEILRCAQNDRDGGIRNAGGAEPRPYGVTGMRR